MRSIDQVLSRSRAAGELEGKGSELRFAPRRGDSTPAILYVEEGPGSVPCLIRDMSTTGARLELRQGWERDLSSGVSVNDNIRLVVRMHRTMYSCKVVRSGTKELGVKFTAPPKPLDKPTRGRV